jgi:ribosomal protein L18
MSLTKPERRQRIRFRIRKISVLQLRLFTRSNKEIYAQLIDDVNGVTYFALQEKEIERYKRRCCNSSWKTSCRESVKSWLKVTSIEEVIYITVVLNH